MARYIQEIKLSQPIDVVSMIMEDYIYHHHFRRNDWNGEMVYYMVDKHGKECYMKWDYTNGVFHLEAWLKNAFGGEEDLKGVGSKASKIEFRKSLELLITTVKRQKASTISGGHVGTDPLHHTSNHTAEHRAQRQGQQNSFGTMPGGNAGSTRTSSRTNTGRNAGNVSDTTNLIFALLALIFSSIPIVGLILAIKCLKRNKGSQSSNEKLITVLCVIAIIVSVMTIFSSLLPTILLPLAELL